MLTEVRDCDLLIVVTSFTFLKRKDSLFYPCQNIASHASNKR